MKTGGEGAFYLKRDLKKRWVSKIYHMVLILTLVISFEILLAEAKRGSWENNEVNVPQSSYYAGFSDGFRGAPPVCR